MNCIKFLVCTFFLLAARDSAGQMIATVAGNGSAGFSGDGGPATDATFNTPSGIAADKFGNFFIADDINEVIHVVHPDGTIWRFAGNGSSGYGGDGSPATDAQLSLPFGTVGMVADSLGDIYFTDGARIRMVNSLGIITTIAGTGITGSTGDGGPATSATFSSPSGLIFDKFGRLYVADFLGNNVRMIDNDGIISTVVGNGLLGFSGDGGPATDAAIKSPIAVSVDASMNIYVADYGNFRFRQIIPSGIISTFAGGNSLGVRSCFGCLATTLKLPCPSGVAVDGDGNVFLSDCINEMLYKVNTSGIINPLSGAPTVHGFSGDGGPASSAVLSSPTSLCVDNEGNILFIDKSNYRVRKILFNKTGTNTSGSGMKCISILPNPTTGYFTVTVPQTTGTGSVTVYDMLGKVITTGTLNGPGPMQFHLAAPPGTYIVQVVSVGAVWRQKLEVW